MAIDPTRQKQVEFVIKQVVRKFSALAAWPFSVFLKFFINEVLEVTIEQVEFTQISADVEKQRIALEESKTDAERIKNGADFIALK